MKKLLLLFVATFVTFMSLKAQNLNTETILRHLKRAEVCIEMNKIDDAINEYQKIMKIAPDWANIYMYLGNVYALKNDDASMEKSIEYYKKFLQMTKDKELYDEASDKLARMEMVSELKAKEMENAEKLVGLWRTSLHNKYTGQPLFIFNITKTPVENKYQITLSPKSVIYDNIVNNKAYSETINNSLNWIFTFQESYIPSQAKHNARGMVLNMLAGDNSLAAAVAGAVNESIRESDVGFTDINDFGFVCDASIYKDKYKSFSDGYLKGSCYMKGEHHQNGLNQITLDSIFECDLLKGDEKYPVLLKIEENEKSYKYGDMVSKKPHEFLQMGGYVSYDLEHKDELQHSGVAKEIGTAMMLLGLPSTIFCGASALFTKNSDAELSNSFGIATAVSGGVFIVGLIVHRCGVAHDNKVFYNKLVLKHNEKVEENRKKYNSEISFVASPIGVGLQMTF